MMEDCTSFQLASMVLLGLASTCMAIWATQIVSAFFGRRRPAPRLPPGPRAWPVIGNMPLMSGPGVHRKLAALAKKHNTPLLSIRLGHTPALVACNAATARQFLHTHDSVFGNRPEFAMPDRVLFGTRNSIGFQDTCDRWRELRKLWTAHLLSQSQVSKKRHIRREEVAHMIASIRAEAEEPMAEPLNIAACMSYVTSNIMSRLVLSERLLGTMKETHPMHALIKDTVELVFTPLVGEFVPLLSFLNVPVKRRMTELRGRTERMLGSMVGDRLRLRSRGLRSDDILDILLDHTRECVDQESRDFIYGTLLEMFLVGMDTSANTMSWAIAELLANPEEMRMVQEELEEVVGMERMVEEDDIPRLKHLRAVVKEVFRLHPVAVMMIPHMSNQDCLVEVPALPNDHGTTKTTTHRSTTYHIPSGTRVFINLWAIGTDEHTWEHPHTFKPARFLDSDIDVKGQHFELLPFGSGRRMCPGLHHGLHVVELTLANLLHCFYWSPATSTMDLSESKSTPRSLVLATAPLAFPKFRLHTNII